jgi:hypothetical protein
MKNILISGFLFAFISIVIMATVTFSLNIPFRKAPTSFKIAWQQFCSPGYSTCYKCGVPWKYAEGHTTNYGNHGIGCFPLCEKCWASLTPKERLPFYEKLVKEWGKTGSPIPEEKKTEIYKAVLEGK